MTSPVDFTTRLNVAGQAVGPGAPSLAASLAQSDLSNSEIQAVGGYVRTLPLAVANRLAQDSGAQTDWTNAQLGQLAAINEPTAQQPAPADSRSFVEQALSGFGSFWSNTGNFLIHNPVTDLLGKAGNFISQVIHWPVRIITSALDPSNNDEVDREMRADGYDPNSTASYLAFMWSQGENTYHDLSRIRAEYGDQLVDAVIQQQRDPQQFAQDFHNLDPASAAQLQQLMNSPDWAKAYSEIDAQHLSPGRDLARILTLGHTQNAAFRALSGVLDGAYDWFADPTLVLGKAAKAARAIDVVTGDLAKGSQFAPSNLLARAWDTARNGAQRAGLRSGDGILDQNGIQQILRVDPETGRAVTDVGKGWERFLSDASDLRAADAKAKAAASPELRQAAEAERAGIYRAMSNRYGTLMDLLGDVNGTRVIAEHEAGTVENVVNDAMTGGHPATRAGAAPITTLPELASYLGSKNGLLRLSNGIAARRELVMPGRLSPWAERTAAKDTYTAARTARKAMWIDYRDAQKLLPVGEDTPILDAQAAAAGDAQNAVIARSALGQLVQGKVGEAAKTARAKWDRLSRRVTTTLPDVTHLDLQDPTSARTVEQLGRFWLNKGDAARLASAYQLSDLAGRRQVVKGVLEQMFHASGLSKSADGRQFMQKYLGDLDEFDRQQYGLGDTSVINRGGDVDGKVQAALYPDQLSTRVLLPGMRQMSYLAAKYSVGGFARRTGLASLMQFGQGRTADALMTAMKLGWIATVAGGLRNALDEVVNFGTYGIGREALRGRAIFSEATREVRADRVAASLEYRRRLNTVGSRSVLDDQIARETGAALDQHEKATRALEAAAAGRPGAMSLDDAQLQHAAATAELKRARNLESAIRYRVPLALRRVANKVNDVFVATALGKAMRVFGKEWVPTTQDVEWAKELIDHELTQVLREGVFQSHFGDDAARMASDRYAMDLHRSGLRARQYAYQRIYQGWGEVEPDGGAGLDAWAKYLQLRFAHPASPAHAWLDAVARNLTDGGGPITPEAVAAGTRAVRAHVDTPEFQQFVDSMEMFRRTKAGQLVGDDPALLAQAKDEYADRVSADLLQGLAAPNGIHPPVLHGGLVDMLVRGKVGVFGKIDKPSIVPDASWLAHNVPTDARPAHTIGQLWAPYNGQHIPGQFPRGYTAMMTKAYDKVVTDQINAISRNPLVTALYLNARQATLPYVAKLKEAGYSDEVADQLARRVALTHAQEEALRHIDNPYVASQFSLLNRNWFAFVRAQEDWLRRWGRTIRDNPEIIRKTQLLLHGANAAGLVESDDQGNATFVYPGSQLMLGLWGKLAGAFGLPNPAQVPVSGELTSQLMLLNPSLDNPIGLSATPLLSFPVKFLTGLLGSDHKLLQTGIDQAINGQMGAGRAWYEMLLPSWANRLIGGVVRSDPGSKYGAAASQWLANAEAAGQLDDPVLQTASGKARLLHSLSVGIHNNLLFTTLFGFVAPAAPSYSPQAPGGAPNDAGKAGTANRPDFADKIIGLNSLKTEFRKAVNEQGFEKALAWWQKVHPGELIYAQGGTRTEAGTEHAVAPATVRAQTWLESNLPFMDRYGGKGGVATYFMPQGAPGTKDGSYSDIAYRAQLELGIREYKSLDKLFDDVVTSRGASEYYAAKDEVDARKQAAADAGDKAAVQAIDAEWQQTKQQILGSNPLLAEKFAKAATDNAVTGAAIQQLIAMAKDTTPETTQALGANRDGLLGLLDAYSAYQYGIAQLGASRSKQAQRVRQELQDTYTAEVQRIAGGPTAQYPELADLARGVFRLP